MYVTRIERTCYSVESKIMKSKWVKKDKKMHSCWDLLLYHFT